jgi:hypothetical protein
MHVSNNVIFKALKPGPESYFDRFLWSFDFLRDQNERMFKVRLSLKDRKCPIKLEENVGFEGTKNDSKIVCLIC